MFPTEGIGTYFHHPSDVESDHFYWYATEDQMDCAIYNFLCAEFKVVEAKKEDQQKLTSNNWLFEAWSDAFSNLHLDRVLG